MKDEKGHGSEKRSGNTVDMTYSSRFGVGGHGKGIYARTADGQQYKLNPLATGGRIPRVGSTIDPTDHKLVTVGGGQPVASNAHAAATLASGAKSAAVDVHPAQQGFVIKASASENPKSPKADQQDYQERHYRYNGSNSKAAVNFGIKKIQAEFPDHRRHSSEIVE